MKETELKKAYVRCCATKGFEPNDQQFKTWKSLMGFFEAEDIEKAIDLWYEEQTTFPMPAELRAVVGRVKRAREARAAAPKEYVGFHCTKCQFTCGDWFVRGEPIPVIACRLNSGHGSCSTHGLP